MRKPWRVAALAVFVLSLALGGLFGERLLGLTAEARDTLRLYTQLVETAHRGYGREVSYGELVFASINGMLRTLDPHTSFLTPEAYSNMREKQQSSFYGLGILVGMRNGQLTIITPIEGTPASRLGLRAGDIIATIEGESTETMTLDEAVQRLKGPKGTQVRITVLRRSLEDPLPLTITRDEIPQNTVRYAYLIAPETGYLLLTDFNRGTAREMADAIRDLKAEGMEQLLLDLRPNGGGLLDQAIEVADQFVPKGSLIVETRGRTRDSFQRFYATGKHSEIGLPVVVLVSGGTASAAEILAGAIQDHDVGLIVGTPTWGKGLVQTVYSLSYGTGLALTTAKYYTPSGRLIQRDYTSWYEYLNHSGLPADAAEETPPGEQGQEFLTDLGRKVYGGGGITPDVIAEPEEISPFLQYLHARNAFFDFAVDYVDRNPVEARSWEPGTEILDDFARWLVDQALATQKRTAEAFAAEETRKYARRQIHAEVFNSTFGLEARHQILSPGDPQIREALGAFDRAAELFAERQRARDKEERHAALGRED